jgi:hypothetical protein
MHKNIFAFISHYFELEHNTPSNIFYLYNEVQSIIDIVITASSIYALKNIEK